jgi:hypothetical protein
VTTCDRVQAELSRRMDENHVLSSDSARHRSICAECAEFEETASEVSERYRIQVRAGVERLRGAVAPAPRLPRKRLPWLIPLAAALLCCLWAPKEEPVRVVAIAKAAPAPVPPRIWPIDEEDLSFLTVRDPLPVRLHDAFWPAEPEIELPKNLRF